jgi:predicted PurR-regulated permease PerM
MPLTHFLLLICAVLLGAAVTLWVGLSAGVPVTAIALVALSAVLLVHWGQRDRHDH